MSRQVRLWLIHCQLHWRGSYGSYPFNIAIYYWIFRANLLMLAKVLGKHRKAVGAIGEV